MIKPWRHPCAASRRNIDNSAMRSNDASNGSETRLKLAKPLTARCDEPGYGIGSLDVTM